LRKRYGIAFRITGVASRRIGWIADGDGLDSASLLASGSDLSRGVSSKKASVPQDVRSWLSSARADVLFEATSLNVETGQPAVDHIRAALDFGAHAITANKGPIVHAYRELRDLATARGRQFLFESIVMDGVPIFSLLPQIPLIHLQGFHGILNSTTNVILSEMENGVSFDDALKKAQALGVAETDASYDVNGWDAAVKTAALITVLMDVPIRLDQIAREGIRDLTTSAVRKARRDGWPFKLVCRARRVGNEVQASVQPEKVRSSEPMARISGTSSYIYFETDIFPGLAITEENPGLYATAYGLFADFIRAVGNSV
jgi:homoserine dehydrogenase